MSGADIPASLALYRAATRLAQPFAGRLVAHRARRGKEEMARIGERKGEPGLRRPAGPLVWLHGASVGETVSLLPIVARLCESSIAVLVTSVTVTSAQVLARRLPPGALHQYAPFDLVPFVTRFLDHWRPDLALFAESELWPNVVVETYRRGIPLGLVNARMSERSLARWRMFPRGIGALLGRFDLCLAQSETDAERFRFLGAHGVASVGNLKYDVPPPPADQAALAELRGVTAGRPMLLAASTHPGEESIIAQAHKVLARRFPRLLTIVAPRHPERGGEAAKAASAAGLRALRRSSGAAPDGACDVYVADTMGELGLFYRLAPVVFMGKSLSDGPLSGKPVPRNSAAGGGHNPIEPAKLGAAIVHGPHVRNFEDIYRELDAAGGARQVDDGQALAECLAELLASPKRLRDMTRAAAQAVARLTGAVERTMQALGPYLDQIAVEKR